MNARPMPTRGMWPLKLAGVIVLLALLFLAGVWLTPAPAPVHALQPPPPLPVANDAPTAVKGVIAAYAALFPQLLHTALPLVIR